jgi:hypothetical protein
MGSSDLPIALEVPILGSRMSFLGGEAPKVDAPKAGADADAARACRCRSVCSMGGELKKNVLLDVVVRRLIGACTVGLGLGKPILLTIASSGSFFTAPYKEPSKAIGIEHKVR